jgi:hypothetical protein
MWGNVPDDWGMYYRKCMDCGGTYHESEGGCGCWEEKRERLWDEIIARLERATIECVEYESLTHYCEDELGDDISKHCLHARVYIDESDGSDELLFTESNWDEVKKAIGYEDPEEE